MTKDIAARVAKWVEDVKEITAALNNAVAQIQDRIYERDQARAGLKLYADAADRAFQGKDAILPDFLPLGACKAEGIVRLALELRSAIRERDEPSALATRLDTLRAAHSHVIAERDALAARVKEADEVAWDQVAKKNAAIARAEKAEAALRSNGFTHTEGAELPWKPPVNEAAGANWRKLIAAEKRAAALAEACSAVPRILYGLGLEDPRQALVVQRAIDVCRTANAAGTEGDDAPHPVTSLSRKDAGTRVVNVVTGKSHEWDGTAWRPLPAPPTADEKESPDAR